MVLSVAVDEIGDVIKLAFAEQQFVTAAREERFDTFQQFRDFRSRIACRDRHRREAEEADRRGVFIKFSAKLLNTRGQKSFMDCRVSGIHMFEGSWREDNSFLVEDFDGRRGRPSVQKTDG